MARKHWLVAGDILQNVNNPLDLGLVIDAWNHRGEPCVKIWWFNYRHSDDPDDIDGPYVKHTLCSISHDPIKNEYGYKVIATAGEDS